MIREVVFGVGFALVLPMLFGLDSGALGIDQCLDVILQLY